MSKGSIGPRTKAQVGTDDRTQSLETPVKLTAKALASNPISIFTSRSLRVLFYRKITDNKGMKGSLTRPKMEQTILTGPPGA